MTPVDHLLLNTHFWDPRRTCNQHYPLGPGLCGDCYTDEHPRADPDLPSLTVVERGLAQAGV